VELAEEAARIAKVLEDIRGEDEVERPLLDDLGREPGVQIRGDEAVDPLLRAGRWLEVDADDPVTALAELRG
jgi:hypothetical protein